jgi:hypothetical protein
MGKKSSAPAKTSSPIPGAGRAADRGVPVSGSSTKPEARAASANPIEDLPQSPAAIGAILNDLHGLIAYGELILRELVSNPDYLAPTPGVIKLEEWLFYLTSRVFPDLGPFQSSGGTIAVKPPDFNHGSWLSVILPYRDCQAVREALQRLQSHLIELNKLDPLRPGPRPSTRKRRRPSPLDDASESWEKQMRSDEEVARKRAALGRDIVTEFDTFLGWFRSLRGQLAVRLLEGDESHGNISRRATVGVGGAADQRETERSPTTAPPSPLSAQMMGKKGVLQAELGGAGTIAHEAESGPSATTDEEARSMAVPPLSTYLGIELDARSRNVRRERRTAVVSLAGSRLMWGLLLKLIEMRGEFCTRPELRKVWKDVGLANDPEDRTMNDALSTLGKKLSPLGLKVPGKRNTGWRLLDSDTPNTT